MVKSVKVFNHYIESIKSFYPHELPKAAITWDSRIKELGKAYSEHIYLSSRLAHSQVPFVVVRHVLWHEYCHIIEPPYWTGKRIMRHHYQFRKLLAIDPALAEAQDWIHDNF